MAEKSKAVYDESKIKTLSSLEHIRLRTGMYIGRIGSGAHPDDGCYVLLKEVVDNAIDEFIMGNGKEVHIGLDGNRVTVRDFGRGIPLGKVVDCVSKINTGAKYNDDVFQFSVGLNGVGTKAVNALSKNFLVRSHREGEFARSSGPNRRRRLSATTTAQATAPRPIRSSATRPRRRSAPSTTPRTDSRWPVPAFVEGCDGNARGPHAPLRERRLGRDPAFRRTSGSGGLLGMNRESVRSDMSKLSISISP